MWMSWHCLSTWSIPPFSGVTFPVTYIAGWKGGDTFYHMGLSTQCRDSNAANLCTRLCSASLVLTQGDSSFWMQPLHYLHSWNLVYQTLTLHVPMLHQNIASACQERNTLVVLQDHCIGSPGNKCSITLNRDALAWGNAEVQAHHFAMHWWRKIEQHWFCQEALIRCASRHVH